MRATARANPLFHSIYFAPSSLGASSNSLIETRTPNRINEDFDSPAPDTTLTARFGHCQGELLNLCLSGCASSNMFDGVMDLGGMIMKGVPEQVREALCRIFLIFSSNHLMRPLRV